MESPMRRNSGFLVDFLRPSTLVQLASVSFSCSSFPGGTDCLLLGTDPPEKVGWLSCSPTKEDTSLSQGVVSFVPFCLPNASAFKRQDFSSSIRHKFFMNLNFASQLTVFIPKGFEILHDCRSSNSWVEKPLALLYGE